MNMVVKLPDATPHQAMAPSNSPAAMMRAAAEQGLDAQSIREMMQLQREWEANEAVKAFNTAFADFKSEAVRVIKRTTITDGPLKGKKHSNLFDVVDVTVAPLAKHGLSTSWKLTKDEPQWMEVTCVLKHVAGHSDSVSMGAAPDTGPGRNAIQARGSAKKYLERYTLMAVLGLADTEDDDGAGANGTDASDKAKAVEREFTEAILAADTVEGLTKLGSGIASAGLAPTAVKRLRDTFAAQKAKIGARS